MRRPTITEIYEIASMIMMDNEGMSNAHLRAFDLSIRTMLGES